MNDYNGIFSRHCFHTICKTLCLSKWGTSVKVMENLFAGNSLPSEGTKV